MVYKITRKLWDLEISKVNDFYDPKSHSVFPFWTKINVQKRSRPLEFEMLFFRFFICDDNALIYIFGILRYAHSYFFCEMDSSFRLINQINPGAQNEIL